MFKFKTKDKIFILKGKHKGKSAIIKKIIKKNNKILAILDGLNFLKKHVKANPNKNKDGGILNIESPINISNLMLINTLNNKKDKIHFSYINGKKFRIFNSNDEILT